MPRTRAALWIIPIFLAAGVVVADSVGPGGLYGLVEDVASFAGDLAGNDLSDSSDNEVGLTDPLSVADPIYSPCTTTNLAAAAVTFATSRNCHIVNCDAGGNTIGTITNGASGQWLFLAFVDASCTVTDTDAATGDTINLNGTATSYTSADTSTLLLYHNGTKWFEVGRKPAAGGFSGDLATDNALTDSSDSEVDIADPIKFGVGTILNCDAEDGACIVSKSDGSDGRVTIGGDTTTTGARWEFNGVPTTNWVELILHRGGGTSELTQLEAGRFEFQTATAQGYFGDPAGAGTVQLGMTSNGYIYWTTSSTSAATPAVKLCSDATEPTIYGGSCPSAGRLTTGNQITSMIGIGQGITARPTCSDTYDGVARYSYQTASTAHRLEFCQAEYDGSSTSYRWQRQGLHANIYLSTAITDLTMSGVTLIDDAGTDWTSVARSGWSFSEPSITVVTQGGGLYEVHWAVSWESVSSNTYDIGVAENLNEGAGWAAVAQCTQSRSMSGTTIGVAAGTCIVSVADDDGTNNDSLALYLSQTAGTDTPDIHHASLFVRSL